MLARGDMVVLPVSRWDVHAHGSSACHVHNIRFTLYPLHLCAMRIGGGERVRERAVSRKHASTLCVNTTWSLELLSPPPNKVETRFAAIQPNIGEVRTFVRNRMSYVFFFGVLLRPATPRAAPSSRHRFFSHSFLMFSSFFLLSRI